MEEWGGHQWSLFFRTVPPPKGKSIHVVLKPVVSTLNSHWLLGLPPHLTDDRKQRVAPAPALCTEHLQMSSTLLRQIKRCHRQAKPFNWLHLGSPSETKDSTNLFQLHWEQRERGHTGALLTYSALLLYILTRAILTIINFVSRDTTYVLWECISFVCTYRDTAWDLDWPELCCAKSMPKPVLKG